MFHFLKKPKEDQTPPETKKPKEDQTPPETKKPKEDQPFTLKGMLGEIVPVDKYIILHAEHRTIYDAGRYKYKLYEWRLYKSPNVSWSHTPDAQLVLYVNGSRSEETTVGLGPAKKEKKRLKYWDVIHQKLHLDKKNDILYIYEVRKDHYTNIQTIFERYAMHEDEITPPPEHGLGSHENQISGHMSNLRVLLHQLQENCR